MGGEWRKYTPSEDDFIIRNYKTMSETELANHLGVSKDRIKSRKRTLKCFLSDEEIKIKTSANGSKQIIAYNKSIVHQYETYEKRFDNVLEKILEIWPEKLPDLLSIKEMETLELLELVCQLHSRVRFPSKQMHDAYVEARNELESRLTQPPTVIQPLGLPWVKASDKLSGHMEKVCCRKIRGRYITIPMLQHLIKLPTYYEHN